MADTMTRGEWSKLDPIAQKKFIVEGGELKDPLPPTKPQISDPAVLTRAEFFALPPDRQRAESLAGRRVVDGERAPPADKPPSTENLLADILNELRK